MPTLHDHKKADMDEEHLTTEDEYLRVREHSHGGARILEDLRTELDARTEVLRDHSVGDFHRNPDQVESLKSEVRRAKRILMGTKRYLSSDFQPTVLRLQESLGTYASSIHEKLKRESVSYHGQERHSKRQLESLRATSVDQETMARLAVELKELEELSAQMTNQVDRLNEALHDASDEADHIDSTLKTEYNAEELRRRHEEEQRRIRQQEEEARRQEEAMERQRQEEEERRRRQEEEDRVRKAEEERLKKEDPRYWPNVVVFELEEESDALASGLACAIRAPEAIHLDKNQIICSAVDLVTVKYPLAENEELASNMVTLKPAGGHDIDFERAVWLAIPYATGPRTKETVIRFQRVPPRPQTPPEKLDDEKAFEEEGEKRTEPSNNQKKPTEAPAWEDLMTRDTTFEGHEHCRFVETYLKHLPADGIKLVVLTRFKRDHHTFNSKGGKMVSTVDHRVSIVAPKNAFRLAVDVSMQIIPIDTVVLAGLKERFEGCESLSGTSPIVRLISSNKPQKPLIATVTNPSGGSKNKRTTSSGQNGSGNDTADGEKVPVLPRTQNSSGAARDEHVEVDYVSLVTKEGLGRWRVREDVVLEAQKDSTTFQLPALVERFLLLRTSSRLQSPELVKIATSLDVSLQEKPVAVIVRQHLYDASRVVIECCKRESLDRMIQKLKEEQYSEGPHPFIVCLREGDVIDVGFSPSGNIDFVNRWPRRLVFNSGLATCRLFAEVKEVDVFAQNALEHYRGNVRLRLAERTYQPPPKFQDVWNAKKNRSSSESGLLCELMVILPKRAKEITQVKKIRLPIKPDGPLCEEYFDQLSSDLGDEWVQVASHLKISKASIQRISTSNAQLDATDATQKCIKDMLREWFLSSTKSTDKTEDLRMALLSAGRNDLAEELSSKNKELRQDIERRQEDANLKKCIRAYCDSQAAVKAWRSVAKLLGLKEDEIARIAGEQKAPTKEMAQEMLRRWKQIRGKDATKDNLIVTLRKLKLNEAAGKVSLIR